MRYQISKNCLATNSAKQKKYAKKMKSKATRLAQKSIARYERVGDEDRASKISGDPRKGWID